MKSRVMGGLLCLLLVAAVVHADEGTRLLRFPDIYGDQVVFSYGGELGMAAIPQESSGFSTQIREEVCLFY